MLGVLREGCVSGADVDCVRDYYFGWVKLERPRWVEMFGDVILRILKL